MKGLVRINSKSVTALYFIMIIIIIIIILHLSYRSVNL